MNFQSSSHSSFRTSGVDYHQTARSPLNEAKLPSGHRSRDAKLPRPFRGHPLYFKGQRYFSVFEGMTGEILQKYIPGFAVRDDFSYQVELPSGHSIDFLLRRRDGALIAIECHPFRIRKQMPRNDYKDWRRELNGLDGEDRERLVDITQRKLIDDYYRSRLSTIRANPGYRGVTLIVVSSVEDILRHVFPLFIPHITINERDFSSEASALKRHIKKTATHGPKRQETDLGFHEQGRRR